MDTPRYVVADQNLFAAGGWSHFFAENDREIERDVRFVWDLEQERLVAMDVRRQHKWQAASEAEIADLTDSLVNANPDFIDPENESCLGMCNELPDWAREVAPEPL